MSWKKLQPLEVKTVSKGGKIIFNPFPPDQYVPQNTHKKQAVLHHTVSDPDNAAGDIGYWLSTTERVATHFVIQGDGIVYQCFSTNLWGYHLGAGNWSLDAHSVGIEIDNWGGLILGDGQPYNFGSSQAPRWVNTEKDRFYNAYGRIVYPQDNEILEFDTPFRTYKYFQKYTEAQIDTVGEILLYLNQKFNIPLTYKANDMWEVSSKALKGEPGVYTHNSYVSWKSDAFPQPELIEMLKSLV
jgi:hypothetical protein